MKDTRNYTPSATRIETILEGVQEIATYNTGYLNNTVDFAPKQPMTQLQLRWRFFLNEKWHSRVKLEYLNRLLSITPCQQIHTKHIIGI